MCLCIHDITRLVASPNDKVFRLQNLSVSRVEIWAYITSVQRKEDAYSCVLDDCTGEIQCFLHIDKTLQNISISDSSLMSMLSNTTLRRFEERVPRIGDMIHLQGVVKNGLWNKVIYLSSSKWKIIDEEESDKLWVDFGERQISLYNEFYKPEIENDDSNIESLSKYFKNKRYKVTLQDSSLIRIVNNIKKESPRITVKEIFLKTTEPTSEFSFLKCLNNSSKVIELVHTTLQSNERSAVTGNIKQLSRDTNERIY